MWLKFSSEQIRLQIELGREFVIWRMILVAVIEFELKQSKFEIGNGGKQNIWNKISHVGVIQHWPFSAPSSTLWTLYHLNFLHSMQAQINLSWLLFLLNFINAGHVTKPGNKKYKELLRTTRYLLELGVILIRAVTSYGLLFMCYMQIVAPSSGRYFVMDIVLWLINDHILLFLPSFPFFLCFLFFPSVFP